MAQPPLKVDALQFEPGSGQTLLIERDAGTGALKFTDNVVGGGIFLNQLAGLQAIGNVFVVGKSGVGAEYTTIQSALDAVPATASPTNPYCILVMPGVYEETLNIVRDGVMLIGIGEPVIQEGVANDDHTVVVSAQLGTIPQLVVLQNLRITNEHNNKAALRLTGGAASTVLGNSQGLFARNLKLEGNAGGGNRTLWAEACGQMTFHDCTFGGNNQCLLLVREMDWAKFFRCDIANAFDFRYEVGQPEPAGGSGYLTMESCGSIGAGTALSPSVAIDCDGAGAAELWSCTMAPGTRIQFSGGLNHRASHCRLGEVSILETPTVNAENTYVESILAPNAGAVFKVDTQSGTTAFAASLTETVTFDIPQPDAEYQVNLELDDRPASDETAWVTNKGAASFDIEFNSAQTLNARWRIRR
jgi:hypothetical protein